LWQQQLKLRLWLLSFRLNAGGYMPSALFF